ncbi:phage/plasmid primase, P4 family [Acetobacterium malicum]|uniref:phage/plasmid primase, P4 family n=1 Tax=Acetobacterium malicum TaxID=52692 RepID=UPI000407E29F|nr:phage/plasmid primase, P4 family [Acetobacterium dehalogenans]
MKNNNDFENNLDKNFPALAAVTPLAITPAAFLAAFGPGSYGLRTFCDQGRGSGQNYTVADGDGLARLLTELGRVNQSERRGVFFVVNGGGHKDAEITRVTAHFVEADGLPLATQWDNLMAFPLPPSIVVRTRKSLHGYWLMKASDQSTDPHLANFRAVQKQLAAHFGGDPVIANPSRVMRLPGFDHHKAEPLAVVCLLFEPGRRYTQAELAAALAKRQPDEASGPGAAAISAPAAETELSERDSQLIMKNCDFIGYCRDHAVNLREPLWYAMITNLAGTRGGAALIHQLSQPDPRYDPAATAAKIAQAGNAGTGPITCQTIRDWGFGCPRLGSCPAKCPQHLGKPPLPPWYQQQPRGLRLKPGVLADYLSRDKPLIYAGEAYYQFIGGVYTMVDENHVKRLIRKQLRVDHVTMAQIRDVLGQLTLLISRSLDKLNACCHWINLKNGLYDLRTGALSPHDRGYLSTIQIATNYDPDATAPGFMAFLGQCLDPATEQLVQELFGYLLIPETCAQKAFVLVGEGGAGKSTLLWVAQDLLLGRGNVSNVPWQSLDDRFKTAELVGKLANIFADLPSQNIADNGLFKSITGEDRITAERKNRDPFAFVATARLVFSCNAIPKNLGDRSAAFYRRLVIVPFRPARPAQLRDPKLKERFIAEAPGIFNWALAGLTRLMANGYRFSESPDSHAALNRYRIDGSSVLSFVAELCVVDAAAQVSSTQIYYAYTEYCRDSGLKPVSQKRFGVELEAEVTGLEKYLDSRSRRKLYKGISLAETEIYDCI